MKPKPTGEEGQKKEGLVRKILKIYERGASAQFCEKVKKPEKRNWLIK